MKTRQIHYFSGIFISLFISVHLLNHLAAVVGISEHIAYMNKFRQVYRNPVVEYLLLLSVILQIISGIQLFFKKRQQVQNLFEKIQIWSGLYLAMFFIIHISAVLAGRFVLQLDTNVYFGIAGMNTFPFNLFFIPYYFLAILSYFGHIAAIHQQKMKHTLLGISPHSQSFGILSFGFLISCIILGSLTNWFQGIEIPKEFHVLIGK